VDDIANVAAHLLTAAEAPNQDYLVVGPELLSYDDIAAILSEVLGRTITHIGMSPAEQAAVHVGLGCPKDFAELLVSLDLRIAEGKEAHSDDSVERVTGQKPVRFRDFADTHRQVWM
jgi:festuclavine dehydrogenase